ncbi:MAG: hypothetical protein H7331_05015 [Bacteroidia bacterium]|nr:hypothetical protein [Bacteroidia bacterium]
MYFAKYKTFIILFLLNSCIYVRYKERRFFSNSINEEMTLLNPLCVFDKEDVLKLNYTLINLNNKNVFFGNISKWKEDSNEYYFDGIEYFQIYLHNSIGDSLIYKSDNCSRGNRVIKKIKPNDFIFIRSYINISNYKIYINKQNPNNSFFKKKIISISITPTNKTKYCKIILQ